MSIDNDALEHVTGGSKAKTLKTVAKVAKTAMKWGGRALELADTVGTVIGGVETIKQGYDWVRGKNQD